MMRILSVFLLICCLFFVHKTYAQNGLNFQGVARNANNQVLSNQTVTLRLSIIEESQNGPLEYSETRKVNTNSQGLFSLVIGEAGAITTFQRFSDIDWRRMPKFLKIELDPSAGDNFTLVGVTQFQSVAYSMYSNGVDAKNVNGVLPLSSGGTGQTSVSDLLVSLHLDQVNNTSDLDKPISSATQGALALKANVNLVNAKEDTLNKSKNLIVDGLSDRKYPTVKAVKDYIDDAVVSGAPDATNTTKGKIALAGALAGTAELPEISNNSVGLNQLKDQSVTDEKLVSIDAAKVIGDIAGKSVNISGVAALANGGTGAITAEEARSNLGLIIGTNVEIPLRFSSPFTRNANAVSLPVASSSVNGYLSSLDWSNFANKINSSEKASLNGVATLDAAGLIPSNQIPAISFQSANVVTSQSAMLALSSAVVGSIAIRTDNNKNYVLSALPVTALSNWIELVTPTSVTSVNGMAGPNVSLTTNNVSEGNNNKYFSNTLARNAINVNSPLLYDANSGAISLSVAGANQDGFLSSSDWNLFTTRLNNKQENLTAGTGVILTNNIISIGQNVGTTANATFATVNGVTIKSRVNGSSIGIGLGALNNSLMTGSDNVGIGFNALLKNTTGNNNVGIGNSVLSNNTTGNYNLSAGFLSLQSNTTGSYNTSLGNATLRSNTIGANNLALGVNALSSSSSANWNTAVGPNSLQMNTTGEMNTGLGASALYSNTTGSYNTALGNRADVATGNLTNATAIGNGAIVNTSYTMQLGDGALQSVNTSAKLTTGAVTYPNTHGVLGQVLATTGAGTLSWTFLTGISSQTLTTSSQNEPFDLTQETGLNGASINIRTAENLANGSGSLASNIDGIANVGVGIRTLKSNTTGTANTALGYETLYSNTIGQFNTGVGTYSLRSNTTGSANTALGSTSLLSNTAGFANVALGEWSLLSNTIGSYNTGVGLNTLFKNTLGNSNLAVGSKALENSTSASWNTALGVNSMRLNTVGEHNTTAGAGTLELNTTGENNTAVGSGALHENATASWNTAIGMHASFKNASGMNNTSMGGKALYYNTSGSNNVAMGYNTLVTLTSGSNNTAIGAEANVTSGLISNSTVIGANATVSSSNTIQLGNTAIVDVKTAGKLSTGSVTYPNTHGSTGQVLSTTGSGTLTWTTLTSSSADLASSTGILSIAKGGTGTNTQNFVDLSGAQTIAGSKSFSEDAIINGLRIGQGNRSLQGNTVVGNTALTAITTGTDNNAFGFYALRNNTTGERNIAVGSEALYTNTAGQHNVAMGAQALYSNSDGSVNTAVGIVALFSNTTGVYNTAFGGQALFNSTASYNTAVGGASLLSNTSGNRNATLGAFSLINNTTGGGNTAIGVETLGNNLTGNNNTAMGAGANVATGDLSNATVIGANATVSSSNTIQLGNTAIVDVKTAGKLSTGSVTYPNTHGSTGQVLSTTGSGTLTWTTLTSSSADLANSTGILSIAKGGTGTNTQNFVDLSGAQTIAGSKSFSEDAIINGLRIGKGPGNSLNNIVIGREAFSLNTSGVGNTAIGDNALHTNNAGYSNTALGDATLASNTTGYNNTAIGSAALYSNYDGINNSAIGVGALSYNTRGGNNIGVGMEALQINSTGSNNVGIGSSTLKNNATGNNNTAIGNSTGLGLVSGNNNTIIGANVTGLSDVSNHIIIANGTGAIKARHDGTDWTLAGSVAIGASAPVASAKLEVNSTTQGFLLPRMTTAQRDAIYLPAEGLSIYNYSTNGYEFFNGIAWVPTTTHYVGESYGGGTVFYVYDNGRHGLIVSNSYQSTGAFWRAGADVNTMALADGVGAGLKNTAIIIASQGYGNGDQYAARICNEYSVTDNGVVYGDWYLPSLKELQLLISNRNYVPNFSNNYHWSSTEASQGLAYCFNNGSSFGTNTKNNWYYVRAIRSF